MHRLTCSKTQQRGSRLKSMRAIHEGYLLITFRLCARAAGISRKFLQEWKHWRAPFFFPSTELVCRLWEPFLKFSIYLASTVHPPPPPPTFLGRLSPTGIPPKQLLPWWAALAGTGNPAKWLLFSPTPRQLLSQQEILARTSTSLYSARGLGGDLCLCPIPCAAAPSVHPQHGSKPPWSSCHSGRQAVPPTGLTAGVMARPHSQPHQGLDLPTDTAVARLLSQLYWVQARPLVLPQ